MKIKRKAVTAARAGKQREVYVSQEYVPGYGWEDVTEYGDTSSESLKLAKQDVRDYRDNGYGARVITRRVANPDYVEPENNITYESAIEWVKTKCPYHYDDHNYYSDGKNISLYSASPSGVGETAFAQIFIGNDNEVRVFNIGKNRTKTVRSIEELEKEISRIAAQNGDSRPVRSSSSMSGKRGVMAAESYGWEVPDDRAQEAYDFAIESGWWDEASLNEDIVRAISSDELAACLAFIFRNNDFQPWDDYLNGVESEDEDEDFDDDEDE